VCNLRASLLIAALFTALITNAQPTPIQAPRQPGELDESSADTTLRFDVVSVKLSVPGADPLEHRLLRITTPDRVRYLGINLKDLMMTAYGLEEHQVVAPDWMNMTDLDVEATMGVGTLRQNCE